MRRFETGSHREHSLPATHIEDDVGRRVAKAVPGLLELAFSRSRRDGVDIQRGLRHDEDRQAETDQETGRQDQGDPTRSTQ